MPHIKTAHFRTITAKYPGTCRHCGEPFEAGDRVRWARGEGTHHLDGDCPDPKAPDHGDDYDDDYEDRMAARADAEYEAGIADAKRYQADRAMFGDELAERFEMDREMAAWNRGDDY